MASISLCMIVKNEEDTLGRCLDSAKDIVDEIIIVDTGSTDNTKNIAYKYTNKVYDFKWCYDFAKARNYSFSKATKDYIMWLDADDVILENDRLKLKEMKSKLDSNVDMIMLKYDLDLLSYYRERIVKKENHYKWIGRIHEVIPPKGNVITQDIAITHKKIHASDPKRNLIIFEKMIEDGDELDARQTFYYARELYYNKYYEKAILEYNKFFDMKDAWNENKISACIDLYYIYLNLGESQKSMEYLFRTFLYDTPRAEACSLVGNYFLNNKEYKKAIFWYDQATNCKLDISNGGFYNKDYYDYIPYLSMCVCYFHLGDLIKSKEYNEKAGMVKPDSKEYINNKLFFENLKLN